MFGFGKNFEEKVNEAVAQLGTMGIKAPSCEIADKVVTIRGVAHDPASKAKAIAWFNEQVETENTLNMIRVEVPNQPPPSAAPPVAVAPPPVTAPAVERADGAGDVTQRMHVVEKGDTLSAISKKYYGKSSDYMKIFNANKDLLKDPDHIYPGQKLRIP